MDRFWSKVNKTETCWLWTGCIGDKGYVQFKESPTARNVMAHRWAYEALVGPIPDGLVLDHLCRVRHCVRPDHMEPVTSKENILRGEGVAAQNAKKTHCPAEHEYVNAPRANGWRVCLICDRQRKRKSYHLRRLNATVGATSGIQEDGPAVQSAVRLETDC